MKSFLILLAVCFTFSVSTKAFACPCSEKNKAEVSTTAKGTLVADAKDAVKDAKDQATDGKTCGCEKDSKDCSCSKSGKACSCGKSCDHKDGKACGCSKKKLDS